MSPDFSPGDFRPRSESPADFSPSGHERRLDDFVLEHKLGDEVLQALKSLDPGLAERVVSEGVDAAVLAQIRRVEGSRRRTEKKGRPPSPPAAGPPPAGQRDQRDQRDQQEQREQRDRRDQLAERDKRDRPGRPPSPPPTPPRAPLAPPIHRDQARSRSRSISWRRRGGEAGAGGGGAGGGGGGGGLLEKRIADFVRAHGLDNKVLRILQKMNPADAEVVLDEPVEVARVRNATGLVISRIRRVERDAGRENALIRYDYEKGKGRGKGGGRENDWRRESPRPRSRTPPWGRPQARRDSRARSWGPRDRDRDWR